MPDFTQYQAPQVFVEEQLSTTVNVIGLRPAVVALIGPGIGFRLFTEQLQLTGEDLVPLSKEGADTSSIEVRSLGGFLYEENVHYEITAADSENNVRVNRIEYDPEDSGAPVAQIDDGESVLVSYQFTDAAYTQPLRLNDFDDVQDAYGPALDVEAGTITSPLSFAAKFAFENGARELVLVATTGDGSIAVNPTEVASAYSKISTMQDVSLVVPLPVGITGDEDEPGDSTTILTGLATAMEQASADGNFRIGLIGFEADLDRQPEILAQEASSPRVVLAWPNKLHYFNGFTNQTIEVGGYYLAAAYAGRLVSVQSHIPLTRKRIFGFSGIPSSTAQEMTKSVKDLWSQSGVSVVETNRNGRLVVRHGVTTSVQNIQSREISLVRARDTLVSLLQETVDGAGLIGTFIDDDTPGRVKSVVAGVLEASLANGTIAGYNDLKARQLVGDPSVIEIKFQYRPSYPLNYIVISFSINTSTGETTLIDQATGF